MDSRAALDKEIAELRQKLKARLEARRALDRLDPKADDESGPYTGMRPLNALRRLFSERAVTCMREDELTKILIDGGITAGRKRKHHNIRISLEVSAKAGSISLRDGWVCLPGTEPPSTASR